MNPAIYFCLLLSIIPLYFLLTKITSKRVPPGSLGLPIVGQTLSLLCALRRNTAENWFQERVRKYGPISKMNIFGAPTVFLQGQAANKFIYTCDGNILANQQPSSIRRIFGERNILELSGHDHKRVRGALVSFLKPEMLKHYVGRIDGEVREHLNLYWHGKEKISAMPLMKILTFNVLSLLITGVEQGSKRDLLRQLLREVMKGLLSVPINLPFTKFNRSLKARARIRSVIMGLIREKRAALEQQIAITQQDHLTSLISLRNEDNSVLLSDEEIVDNAIGIMIGGHDTTSVLLSLLIRNLANDPSVYACILEEQEEIAKSKASGELLTWDDLSRMKYTWRVAMETLRMTPPAFFSFRKVLKDFEYEGYLIPKGWQVIWAAFSTHMDESIFPNASKFDPARFEKQCPPYCFMAFGGGPRICPGYEFTKIETLVAIHNLVTQFKWRLCDPEISFSIDPMPTFKEGLEIQIEPKISSEISN